MTTRLAAKRFGRSDMRDFGGPQTKRSNRRGKHASLKVAR